MAKKKQGDQRNDVPEMTNEGQTNLLQWLQGNPPADELIETVKTLQAITGLHVDRDAGFDRNPETGRHNGVILQGFDLLPPDVQEQLKKIQAANEYLYNFAVETAVGRFTSKDSGLNVINASQVTVNLMKRETGEIKLGTNPETGEPAIFTILGGYITPYEKEIIECISKFKIDGQITENNKIWFTVGQLYRAMRHGAGTQSPTKEQRAELMAALTELSEPDRKLTFKLNDYLKVWGGFETNGGRLRIIGFDELFGKIRGQEDILIILDDTPIICAVADNLHMWEPITQEIKAIKQRRFTVSYLCDGKVKKRSFDTNEKRRKFCNDNGIQAGDIVEHGETVKPWALSTNRIAIRSTLLTFVYGYIRARAAGANSSDKMPYEMIFERCGISDHHETRKRIREDIGVIMNHLTNTVDDLQAWGLYQNKNTAGDNFDGVIIFLQQPERDKYKNVVVKYRKPSNLIEGGA